MKKQQNSKVVASQNFLANIISSILLLVLFCILFVVLVDYKNHVSHHHTHIHTYTHIHTTHFNRKRDQHISVFFLLNHWLILEMHSFSSGWRPGSYNEHGVGVVVQEKCVWSNGAEKKKEDDWEKFVKPFRTREPVSRFPFCNTTIFLWICFLQSVLYRIYFFA